MRFSKITLAIGCFVLFSFLFFSPATSYSDEIDIEIEIDVAPNVLNIQSEGTVVTVHTDIPYSSVDAPTVSLVYDSTVPLNEIEISWWKDDNRGNFVAKFSMDEVKSLFEEDDMEKYNTYTFVLEGFTTVGDKFSGEQDIIVIDVLPKEY